MSALRAFTLASMLTGLALTAAPARAQQGFGTTGYDDYGSFSTDPVDLDNEVSDMFGRFFQNSFHLGTNIFTDGLGEAYSAGVLLQLKFIFYFDKIWAGELGAGWAQHSGVYNATNTRAKNVNVEQKMTYIPVSLGIRYGFDQEVLPRGLAVMNPYLSGNAEYVFRSEEVVGTPTTGGLSTALQTKITTGAVNSSTGVGINFGGGMEFDVYRRKLFLGLDLRYHMLFWSDADVLFGTLNRKGNALSILGTLTYNY
ncbi:MAG: outer membrane beta-barrel protein [Bdellovibrionales bacterium]|nr:outer membrane beta-barrel protein [Bdellovibrionales bacterium]